MLRVFFPLPLRAVRRQDSRGRGFQPAASWEVVILCGMQGHSQAEHCPPALTCFSTF